MMSVIKDILILTYKNKYIRWRADKGYMDKRVLLTKPSMPSYEEYIEAIKPLWETHWLTNMGTYHKQFEEELKRYLGVPELSLMVNGHMALELIIQAFGFPEESEIITTPFTFISTTHAIVRNHLQPVFCDVKEEDGTMDETKIEGLITEKTVAIVPVHVYGNVCNIEKIEYIACKHHLKVIYDAAHAFGVNYKGKGIGCYGDASAFSFHATKVYNTIEGGAVSFCKHKLYEKLYNLKNFGIHGEELVVDIGANAKMNEFAAIMGICNLRHIDADIEKRRQRAEYYLEQLSEVNGVRFFSCQEKQDCNYSYFPLIITQEFLISRDQLYMRLKEKGIYARKYFYPITADQACFRNQYKNADLKKARYLAEHILVLPLYADLKFSDIDRICMVIRRREN